jgi:hypothetical protein
LYKKYLTTFIDILGFEEIIMNVNTSVSDVLQNLQVFRKIFGDYENIVDEKVNKDEFVFKVFSDSVLRAVDISEKSGTEILYSELKKLIQQTLNMTINGNFVRGAMTVGNMYFDDNNIIGPAFIELLKMEKHISRFPRIVLSPKVLSNYKLKINIYDFLRIDNEGFYYIDYFKAGIKLLKEVNREDMIEGMIDGHYEAISEKLSTVSTDISNKYIWLANYHNIVLRELVNEKFISNAFLGWRVFKEVYLKAK